MLLASLVQGKYRGIMLGMEADEHLAEGNIYVCELHNVLLLLGCVSFCIDFSAFVVSITNTAPLVHLTACLLYFPQNLG